MTRPADTPPVIARYLSRAGAVLAALEQLIDDQLYVEEKNASIEYFIDTNIVISYAKIEEGARFVPLLMAGNAKTQRADSYISFLLLAENLFSGRLLGKQNLPCLVAPPHLEEFLNKFDDLQAEMPTGTTDNEKLDVSALREAIADLERKKTQTSLNDAFDSLREIVMSTQSGYRIPRLIRLLRQQSLVSGESLADFTTEISEPPNARVDVWRAHLTTALTESGLSENAENDALALTQIEMLNENAARTDQKRKYVLVTNDNSIHQAVLSWRAACDEKGVNVENFTRHPRQYLPLFLSPQGRGENDNTAKMQRRLYAALQSPMLTFSEAFQHRRRSELVGHDHEANLHEWRELLSSEKWARLNKDVQKLQRLWRAAMRQSALMNIEILQNVLTGVADEAVKLLNQEVLENIVETKFSKSLNSIDEIHLSLAIRGRLIGAAMQATRSGPASTRFKNRTPLLLKVTDSKILDVLNAHAKMTNPASVNVALNHLFSNADEDQFRAIESRLTKLGSIPKACAIAAFICFRASSWRATKFFAERARRTLLQADEVNADEVRFEVEHALAVAERFLIDSLSSFQQLRLTNLQRQRSHARDGDGLRAARASSEMGALGIFFAYKSSFGILRTGGLSGDYVKDALNAADRELQYAVDYCRKANSAGDLGDKQILRGIEYQCCVNQISSIVCRFGIIEKTNITIEEMSSAIKNASTDRYLFILKSATRTLGEHSGHDTYFVNHITELYRNLGLCLIERDHAQAIKAIDQVTQEFFIERKKMSELDIAVFTWARMLVRLPPAPTES